MGHVELPKGVDLSKKGSNAYKPTQVHRKSVMTFEKGKTVFILDDPSGMPWVMQAYSDIVDPDLTYDDLGKLGDKLKLAPGWKFRTKILDQDLTIQAVNGVARIVQDDLENTYDACFSLLLNVTQVLHNRQYASFNNGFGIARKIEKRLNIRFIHLCSQNRRGCMPPLVNFPSRHRQA